MDGKAMADAMEAFVVFVGGACLVIGGLAVWGLPKLWALIKPWIHAVTG